MVEITGYFIVAVTAVLTIIIGSIGGSEYRCEIIFCDRSNLRENQRIGIVDDVGSVGTHSFLSLVIISNRRSHNVQTNIVGFVIEISCIVLEPNH